MERDIDSQKQRQCPGYTETCTVAYCSVGSKSNKNEPNYQNMNKGKPYDALGVLTKGIYQRKLTVWTD